jgi:hypothetical protein
MPTATFSQAQGNVKVTNAYCESENLGKNKIAKVSMQYSHLLK